MKVAIFFGSKSDTEIMRGAANCLKEFGVEYKAYVLSAHRVPEKLTEVLIEAEANGCEVVIAGAGLSCTFARSYSFTNNNASNWCSNKWSNQGLDALFSIVQMPKSIPVATVGINNSYNAGMLAVQMLAIKDEKIKEKLKAFREDMKKKFIEENGEGVDL